MSSVTPATRDTQRVAGPGHQVPTHCSPENRAGAQRDLLHSGIWGSQTGCPEAETRDTGPLPEPLS